MNENETTGGKNDNLLSAIAYIIFFVPLLAKKRSSYVTFHTNQGTILFIVAIFGNIVLSVIPVIGWIILPFYNLAVFIFVIMGILNATGNKKKPLPFFGHLEIIK